MALEIQEIGIRLRVDPNDRGSGAPFANESESEKKKSESDACCGTSEAERESIVRDCVRRVLRALEGSQRR